MGTCISNLYISLEEIHMKQDTQNKHATFNIPSTLPNTIVREVVKNGKTIVSLRAKWGPLFEDSNAKTIG